jgi:hypothetical protein
MPINGGANGQYYFGATAAVGIYAKKSGVWTRVMTHYVTETATYYSSERFTIAWIFSETVQMGTGIQAFGVAIESVTGYSNPTALIQSLSSVSWQAISNQGGESSATPDGQTTSVTVTPQ